MCVKSFWRKYFAHRGEAGRPGVQARPQVKELELSTQIHPWLSFRAMSSASGQPHASHSYETLKVSRVREKVFHVELNRPDKRNAMNSVFWREMVECFNKIAQDSECHAVVVSGAGKLFSAGIDLVEMGSVFMMVEGDDMARKAWNMRKKIREHQESFSVLEKEVDIGLAADVGTLQRLPRIIGNQSLVNELAFTARKMMAPEAESSGLVSRVFQDKQAMLEGAFELAADIAGKSPVAVQGTKINILYSRDHSVPEGLRYIATWNMSMLQTEDILKSAQAALEKKSPKDVVYSKL
ncbi:delta(3,5)-Delta(2,4)-dienoyl-CoA isomerase, mitochondrial isoform X3 [Emydura macquarii macquarii]|uniref:delta(3,5)-Delta(2,4)-dienoyl-CoA isomerase, mitochondrial isoform X3 n=1 Tax=Emydura macquarii macquarii TaxID=1129001 RepID=UPI00352B3F89